jgi:cell division septation protein DedD
MPTPSTFADASATPSTSGSGTMDALYRAAIGPVQLPRYLALFERFDQAGRAPAGWNWAASLATLNWMLLHHLWTAALIYVALVEGLALLIFGVGRPLLHWPEQVEWGLIAAFALFAIALPGLFGDALLHSEIRKRIARALVAAHSIPEACELLARQASHWRRLRWIALANVLLFSAIALAWALAPPSGWSHADPPAATMATGPVETARPALPGASLPAIEPLPITAPTASSAALRAASSEFLSPNLVPRPDTASEPAIPASAPAAPVATESASSPKPEATTQSTPSTGVPASTATALPARSAGKQPAKSSATPSTQPSKPSPSPATAAPAKAASVPATPASTGAPLGSAPGYYLNVGVFAEEANARRAQAKLLNANLPAFRQTFDTDNGKRTRVRVGPFKTAAQAQKAAAQVRSLQLEAVMFWQRG